jgi:hypothetical protein
MAQRFEGGTMSTVTRRHSRTAAFSAALALLAVMLGDGSSRLQAADRSEQFAELHRLIRPQPGELRFHEIPWLLDVWEARKKAAAEGKPILVWSGAGGAPLGVC